MNSEHDIGNKATWSNKTYHLCVAYYEHCAEGRPGLVAENGFQQTFEKREHIWNTNGERKHDDDQVSLVLRLNNTQRELNERMFHGKMFHGGDFMHGGMFHGRVS